MYEVQPQYQLSGEPDELASNPRRSWRWLLVWVAVGIVIATTRGAA